MRAVFMCALLYCDMFYASAAVRRADALCFYTVRAYVCLSVRPSDCPSLTDDVFAISMVYRHTDGFLLPNFCQLCILEQKRHTGSVLGHEIKGQSYTFHESVRR